MDESYVEEFSDFNYFLQAHSSLASFISAQNNCLDAPAAQYLAVEQSEPSRSPEFANSGSNLIGLVTLHSREGRCERADKNWDFHSHSLCMLDSRNIL